MPNFKISSNTKIKQSPAKITGLGDIVALVAEPVKHLIVQHAPKAIASKMKDCNCKKRREMLNKMFPIS